MLKVGNDSVAPIQKVFDHEEIEEEGGLLLPFSTEEKTLKSVDNYRKYMSWLLRICYKTHQESTGFLLRWGWV